jgi:hypothetical protein
MREGVAEGCTSFASWRCDFVLPLTALFDAKSCFPAQSKAYLVPMFILCRLSLDII